MKKIYLNILLLMAVASTATISSCNYMNCLKGSGHMLSENRKVKDFTRISIDGDFKIILKQDSSLNLTINADDNLLKNIETEVDASKLHIYARKHMCGNGDLTITIGVRNLEELKAQGAIEVTADGKLNVKDIKFNLSGASKITLDLNAANVTTSGSGATEMNLKGQATSHKVDFSGVGKLYALDFVVGSYEIHSSGASENNINVLQSLRVSSSGAATVKYKGNPSITQDKSGALSIEKVN